MQEVHNVTTVVEDREVLSVAERGVYAAVREEIEVVQIVRGVELLIPPVAPTTVAIIQEDIALRIRTPGPQGARGLQGIQGIQGIPGVQNLYIQDTMPTEPSPWLWVQTGIGPDGDYTVWFDTPLLALIAAAVSEAFDPVVVGEAIALVPLAEAVADAGVALELIVPQAAAVAQAGSMALPDADVSGTWIPSSGSDLYAMLDEPVVDDGDYVYANFGDPSGEVSLPTPESLDGLMVVCRAWDRGVNATLSVTLLQGSTVIATWNENLGRTVIEYVYVLTPEQVAAITDPSDLRLRFESDIYNPV